MEATVLFADLAGFTALTEVHGDDDAADLAGRFYELARDALRSDARLVKTIGDAVMIVGARPADVVTVVLHLVEATEREVNFPALRAGLHAGPVAERAGDVFGSTVNVAARVAAHARSGQILCTTAVARALEPGPVRVQPAGSAQFKNVSEPIELFEIRRDAGASSHSSIDPVCRMRVDPTAAPASVRHGEQIYAFCSPGCAEAFTRTPDSYRRG
jgi:adenylate cyclase